MDFSNKTSEMFILFMLNGYLTPFSNLEKIDTQWLKIP